MPVHERSAMELRDYLSVLRRRKLAIILAVLAVAASALAASSLQTPIYKAQARVLLQPVQTAFGTGGPTNIITAADIGTEIQYITSPPVRDAVRNTIGIAPRVTAAQIGDTKVIAISAESTSPKGAAEIANAYAEAYIDYRRQGSIDSLVAVITAIQSKVDELKQKIADYDAANPRMQLPANAPPTTVAAERTLLESQQFAFEGKVDQLTVDLSLRSGGAQVVSPAEMPRSPIRPNPIRDAMLGLMVGLIFGIALAFVLEHLDESVNDKEDLQRTVRDTAVIGVIPLVSGWKNRGDPKLVSLVEPSSPAAEAYRTLRTSIQFLKLDRSMRSLQITSPSASEGKTTTTANLSIALAQQGMSVCVLSCDLRRPRIHEFYGVANTIGFTSVLLGEAPLSQALQPVTAVRGGKLMVLPSGPLPPNPSELLASKRANDVIRDLQTRFDILLVDSPPVLPVTDAAVLASQVDGTIMIATAGTTSRRGLARAFELLRQVDAPILGVVLNGASAEGAYGYPYYYSHPQENGRKTKSRSKGGEPSAVVKGRNGNGSGRGGNGR